MFISGNGRRCFFPVSITAFDTHLASCSVGNGGCLHTNWAPGHVKLISVSWGAGDWLELNHYSHLLCRNGVNWRLAGAKPLLAFTVP
jgi:hypothetical protein